MFKISHYDHVGVRVTERERAVAFYEKLGFVIDADEDEPQFNAVGMVNGAGVRINIIYNGITPPANKNVLMDISEKWPGYTHYAFMVDNLEKVVAWAKENNFPITEGPMEIGGRRTVCFIRDPDGNVVEFDEVLPEWSAAHPNVP
jgi:catechol 2,3-dioxygenase-like lactoylglutathione lyase family enzyme